MSSDCPTCAALLPLVRAVIAWREEYARLHGDWWDDDQSTGSPEGRADALHERLAAVDAAVRALPPEVRAAVERMEKEKEKEARHDL